MNQHCNQCDFEWESRVADPSCCPRCKRYDWAEHKKSPGRVSRKSNRGVAGLKPLTEIPRAPAPIELGGGVKHAEPIPLAGERKIEGGRLEPSPDREAAQVHLCRSCEEPLVASGGKLYCANQACSDRGIEQKVRRMK